MDCCTDRAFSSQEQEQEKANRNRREGKRQRNQHVDNEAATDTPLDQKPAHSEADWEIDQGGYEGHLEGQRN